MHYKGCPAIINLVCCNILLVTEMLIIPVGKLENTMLNLYLKDSKFHAWLTQPDFLPSIKECKVLLDQAYGVHDESYKDDLCALDTTRVTNVPQDLCHLIGCHSTIMCAHLNHSGVVYSQSSTHLGSLQIMFFPDGITHFQQFQV